MNARARSLISTICFIGLGGLPHERAVFAPEPDPGGGGGGGGGGNADPPKFTQADIDRVVEDRVKKSKAEAAEAKKQADEVAAKLAEQQKLIDELELKGKSAEEKARINAEKAAEKIRKDAEAEQVARKTAEAERDAARAELRSERMGLQLQRALLDAKALPGAVSDAIQSFQSFIETDVDDKHQIIAVRVNGVKVDSLAKAAEEYLRTKPHFASAPPGGTGSNGQGRNGIGGKPLHERTDAELLQLDAQTRR